MGCLDGLSRGTGSFTCWGDEDCRHCSGREEESAIAASSVEGGRKRRRRGGKEKTQRASVALDLTRL